VAYDEAFCFYYQESFDLHWALGAELKLFSPMKEGLPAPWDLRGGSAQDGRVLPAGTIMIRRFQAQEYVEGEAVGKCPVAATGKTIGGHGFHDTRMDRARGATGP